MSETNRMDYAEIAAIYLTPDSVPAAGPRVPDSPARQLRDALEPIGTIGWWAPATGAQAAALGLDFLANYVWGRAASLGADVEPAVVTSAFGVFDGAFIAATVIPARAKVPHADILATRERGAVEGLAAAAGTVDVATITAVGDRLLAAAAGADGAARPLFSGLRALPVPPRSVRPALARRRAVSRAPRRRPPRCLRRRRSRRRADERADRVVAGLPARRVLRIAGVLR
ncbi:MAG TPA: hypothetical protein VFU35_15650 [Jatrophihabitans sp.]|nr:hypothetical protein [Jatrophihabitans sp.]